ncbi:hypothetical protein N328_00696, partial [Gavia stellata]
QTGLGMENFKNARCCFLLGYIYRDDLVAKEFLRHKIDSVPISCQLSWFF